MAKLLQLSRASRRRREVVRTWLAVLLQERRRTRAAGHMLVPPAPVITGATCAWNPTADVTLTFTFNSGSWPVATIEIYMDAYTGNFQLVGTVASTVSFFTHHTGYSDEQDMLYRVRYCHGSTVSPYSNVWPVNIAL